MTLYGKKGLYFNQELMKLMETTKVNGIPVLVNREKLHENLTAMSGSRYMNSEQLQNAAAKMNVATKAKKKSFRIAKKITRHGRHW